MSLHPIADKAEVSVDFPDKAYMGSFSRHSQFDAYADTDSVAIRLVRPGEDRREAVVHLHYGLLAGILAELARSLTARDPLDEQHRTELSEAAKQLAAALEPRAKSWVSRPRSKGVVQSFTGHAGAISACPGCRARRPR